MEENYEDIETCGRCGKDTYFRPISNRSHPIYFDSTIINEECEECGWQRQKVIEHQEEKKWK